MKFLAILKDSLREALDTKVIYFTLGLSLLIIVLMGSLAFRPVPVDEQVRTFTSRLNWALSFAAQGKGLHLDLADYQETNVSAVPWERNYRFTYVITLPDADAEQAKKMAPHELKEVQRQFHDLLPWAEKVEVTEAPAKANELRFEVRTSGSKIKDRRGWPHEPSLFFGALPLPFLKSSLAGLIDFLTDKVIAAFGAGFIMLLSTVITAFFIPNMLRKGTVDLLLVKPIHRPTLLIFKFIGGLSFMFINTLVIFGGIWLVLGLRTQMWLSGLLLCVLVLTYQFAIFYAISTLMGVLTRSPIVAILMSCLAWVILFGIGWGYRWVDSLRPAKLANTPEELRPFQPELPAWVFPTADAIHLLTPHYKDLDVLVTKLIGRDLGKVPETDRQGRNRRGITLNTRTDDEDEPKDIDKQFSSINWTESLTVTTGYLVVLVGLACWRFASKDY
ncbi:MAG TPA: ABC transporter permease [Gemmataceae bacterium]|nr:ABC transporter permease [Gemmataceae bacterium]